MKHIAGRPVLRVIQCDTTYLGKGVTGVLHCQCRRFGKVGLLARVSSPEDGGEVLEQREELCS